MERLNVVLICSSLPLYELFRRGVVSSVMNYTIVLPRSARPLVSSVSGWSSSPLTSQIPTSNIASTLPGILAHQGDVYVGGESVWLTLAHSYLHTFTIHYTGGTQL